MNKKTFVIIFAALLAMAVGVSVQWLFNSRSNTEIAQIPLEFSFPDTADQMQSISQWRGKILVINFWATWCPPCIKEIPDFIKLQSEYQQQGVQFVGIAIDDKAAVQDFLNGISINYPILIAGDAGIVISHQLGNIIDAVPFTIVINQQGQAIFRQPGELSAEELRKTLSPLLAKK
jgi:thiol-disulfide isomerase/thioredoxin